MSVSQISGTILEQVQCFKYLGLWFDPFISWKIHGNKISGKISQRIGIMSRVGNYVGYHVVPPDVTDKLYKALDFFRNINYSSDLRFLAVCIIGFNLMKE